ncbi:MAG TPA: helix-turn-helix transcriptional regulator [Chthoniobacterales bacterium]
MRRSLLHALFPIVRAEILRLLLTNRGQELYVRQLARLSFLSLHTVQEELAKLHAAHLVLSRTNGYHRFYRANPKHPLYPGLRQVVIEAASRPRPAIRTRQRRAAKV